MKKELVAVKNRIYWDIIFNVSLSENLYLSNPDEVIEIIKQNYTELENSIFLINDIEIFALIDNIGPIN